MYTPTEAPITMDGLEILLFIIRTDAAYVCCDLQLARALQASTEAGAYRKDEHPATVKAIGRARDLILLEQRYRATLTAEPVAPEISDTPADSQPSGGSKVPRKPLPVAPIIPAVVNPF